MEIHTTTTRQELGALRLPWCVDARTRSSVIWIASEPARIREAVQLRVRSVEDEAVQAALAQQAAKGGFSWAKIRSIVEEAEQRGHPPEIRDSMAFRVAGDLSLVEGCHRTCATYLLGPPAFALATVVLDSAEGSWPDYYDPRLRVD